MAEKHDRDQRRQLPEKRLFGTGKHDDEAIGERSRNRDADEGHHAGVARRNLRPQSF